jgi:aryl-alcohol dehydrogenase-like predicted oxidoreductase
LVWDDAGKISHNLQADSMRRMCEASLKRLVIDAIDLYQIHWPASKDAPEAASPGSVEEAVGALAKLKDQGKIRHIGVSNFNVSQMQRAQSVAPITSLQPQYSLVAIEVGAAILPYALSQRLGVSVYSPMGSGLLTGAMTRERIAVIPEDDWRKRDREFSGATTLAQSEARRDTALNRPGPQGKSGRGRDSLDVEGTPPSRPRSSVSVNRQRGNVGGATLELTPDEVAEIEDRVTREAA